MHAMVSVRDPGGSKFTAICMQFLSLTPFPYDKVIMTLSHSDLIHGHTKSPSAFPIGQRRKFQSESRAHSPGFSMQFQDMFFVPWGPREIGCWGTSWSSSSGNYSRFQTSCSTTQLVQLSVQLSGNQSSFGKDDFPKERNGKKPKNSKTRKNAEKNQRKIKEKSSKIPFFNRSGFT